MDSPMKSPMDGPMESPMDGPMDHIGKGLGFRDLLFLAFLPGSRWPFVGKLYGFCLACCFASSFLKGVIFNGCLSSIFHSS